MILLRSVSREALAKWGNVLRLYSPTARW